MFKLLHTSDWHLGKKLAGYDRLKEFEDFFVFLKQQISEHRPNALLISGDVFDTGSPSNEIAKRYCGFVVDLHTSFPDLSITITSGNHDSPSFLDINAKVLEYFSANVCVGVEFVDNKVDWEKIVKPLIVDNQEVAIMCAVPYLRSGDISRLGTEATFKDFYAQLYTYADKVRDGRDIPIIASGHFTALGSTISDGTPSVGGLDDIIVDDFPPFSYIGLGHIHRAQHCGNRVDVRYSGSPLAYSFGEKTQNKSITFVTFEGKNITEIKKVDIPQRVKMLIVPEQPSNMSEIEIACKNIPDDLEAYVEINIKQEYKNPENKSRIIDEFLKGKKVKFCDWYVGKQVKGNNALQQSITMTVQEFKNTNPLDIMSKIYRQKNGADLDQKYINMLNELLTEINHN